PGNTAVMLESPRGNRYMAVDPATGVTAFYDIFSDSICGCCYTGSIATLDLQGPFGPQHVALAGPSCYNANFADAGDTNANGLDEAQTELTEYSFFGSNPQLGTVAVRLRSACKAPLRASTGRIEESINNFPGEMDLPPYHPGPMASSFFNVFVDVDLGGQ